MPVISQRGVEIPSSPIRKLTPLANNAKARGIKVYHLNIGQPDLPTPESALDAVRMVDRKVLEYSPSQGFLSLRKKLAEYYSNSMADELVFYDITASYENRSIFTDILKEAAKKIFIPLTVGGGINTLEDFDRVLKCGADKVS